MRPSWHRWWRLTALGLDAAALTFALGGAALLRFGPPKTVELAQISESSLLAPWLLALPIWIASFTFFGLYNPVRTTNGVEEGRRLVAASFAAPTAFVLLSFSLKTSPSRIWVGIGTLASIAFVGGGRRLLRHVSYRLRIHGHWVTRSLVVGSEQSKGLLDSLDADSGAGLIPVATSGFTWGELPSFDSPDVHRAVRELQVNALVIVGRDLEREEVHRMVAVGDDLPVSLLMVPGLDYALVHNLQIVPVGREPALSVEAPSLHAYQRMLKRTLDLSVAVLGLILASPLLFGIALAIRLDSSGPVFFRQRRRGWEANDFHVVKFRTMTEDADKVRCDLGSENEADGVLFKMHDDPRVTRVGKFLRRWSLDEIPQLWNVIRGEMSIVGPRPLPVSDYDLPSEEYALRRRLRVRPGLTGLWQVSGRSDAGTTELLRLDVIYVQNWGLLLDLYIIVRTLPALLGGRGAY